MLRWVQRYAPEMERCLRLLSAKGDTVAAKRFLAKALAGANHPHPRVINTDKDAGYPPAIVQLKAEGALEENCRHRPVQYLDNVLEQNHRAVKRRANASQYFRSFWAAWRTIAGYEAIHMIRKDLRLDYKLARLPSREWLRLSGDRDFVEGIRKHVRQ